MEKGALKHWWHTGVPQEIQSRKARLHLFGRLVCLGLILVVIFTGLMCLAYSFPNKTKEPEIVAEMQRIMQSEDARVTFKEANRKHDINFQFDDTSVLEMFTKDIWIGLTQKDDGDNILQAAMVPLYSRYWHGIEIALRPALALVSFSVFQTIAGIVFIILLLWLLAVVWMELGWRVSLCFSLSFLIVRGYVVPFNLYYSIDFFIMLIACLVLLYLWNKPRFRRHLPEFFFVIGACMSFFATLLVPVVSLVIPLMIGSLLLSKEDKQITFKAVVLYSAAWVLGWAGLWAAKILLTIPILGITHFLDHAVQVFFTLGIDSERLLTYATKPANHTFYSLGLSNELKNLISLPIKDAIAGFLFPLLFVVVIVLVFFYSLMVKSKESPCLLPLLKKDKYWRGIRAQVKDRFVPNPSVSILYCYIPLLLYMFVMGGHLYVHRNYILRITMPIYFCLLYLLTELIPPFWEWLRFQYHMRLAVAQKRHK
ncbi:MAG: hypothetical protein LBR73_08620 [Oscillospiraceae bacterium]|jgi:hypothetical protein|nr:hypothetical protein [Oscillospiraceae bacterium]